jgi:hypothetical protein
MHDTYFGTSDALVIYPSAFGTWSKRVQYTCDWQWLGNTLASVGHWQLLHSMALQQQQQQQRLEQGCLSDDSDCESDDEYEESSTTATTATTTTAAPTATTAAPTSSTNDETLLDSCHTMMQTHTAQPILLWRIGFISWMLILKHNVRHVWRDWENELPAIINAPEEILLPKVLQQIQSLHH